MTLNQTRLDGPAPMDALLASLRRGFSLAGRLVLGAFIILAAGILAVATAVAGLVIASVALVIGLLGRMQVRRAARRETGAGPQMTLEARRTPRGWTVE